MSETVTCKDCANNRASWFGRHFASSVWWTCSLEKSEPKYDLVDGRTRPGEYISCSSARWDERLCGKNASQWKPRNKKDLFVYLKRI